MHIVFKNRRYICLEPGTKNDIYELFKQNPLRSFSQLYIDENVIDNSLSGRGDSLMRSTNNRNLVYNAIVWLPNTHTTDCMSVYHIDHDDKCYIGKSNVLFYSDVTEVITELSNFKNVPLLDRMIFCAI